MASREFYRVNGNTLEDVIRTMNIALQRIADRLDKLEGVRGDALIQSDLDLDGNKIVNAGIEEIEDDALFSLEL